VDAVAITAAWLTAIGIPTQAPPVELIEIARPKVAAYAQGGTIYTRPAMLAAWNRGEKVAHLHHELIHVSRQQAGIFTDDLRLEEGIAAALAADLWRPWMYRFNRARIDTAARSWSYKPQAAWVRGLSAMGCRCDATEWAARRWRITLATSPDAPAMVAAALAAPALPAL
jgi:hypothetical protein